MKRCPAKGFKNTVSKSREAPKDMHAARTDNLSARIGSKSQAFFFNVEFLPVISAGNTSIGGLVAEET